MNDPRLQGVKMVYYSVSENFLFSDRGRVSEALHRNQSATSGVSAVRRFDFVVGVGSSRVQSSGGGYIVSAHLMCISSTAGKKTSEILSNTKP